MDFTKFYTEIRQSLFKGSLHQDHVDGINVIMDTIAGFKGDVYCNQTAYILATAYHETAFTMQPVRETLAKSDKQAMARLENAWKSGKLSWVKKPYWRKGWFGRGYVQLTHKYNYKKMSDILNVDLVANPSLALDSEIAALILIEGMMKGASGKGDFTGHKLEDHVNLNKSDYASARKVVNGSDKKHAIAGYANKFESALKSAGYDTSQKLKKASPDSEEDAAKKQQIAEIRAKIAELEALLKTLAA